MRIPTATYRLQFCRDLTFQDADGLVEYLDDLGISDIYASPILTARPGSRHGYDIIDPSHVNSELGTEQELITLGRKLRERDMGLLLDTVPNHMCIAGAQNAWWSDVLENGPSSTFASYFDIDWEPPKSDLVAKVLLPILGEQYGRVLENQELQVRFETGSFSIDYAGNRLPVAPRTWTYILEPAVKALRRAQGDRSENVLELESIVTALTHLPLRIETDRAKVRERRREKEIVKRRLAALCESDPEVERVVRESVADMNGRRDDPRSFDRLEHLLNEQGYRPSHWRVASDEINYRRFFDINELAAIRVEEAPVFAAVHEILIRLIGAQAVTGLRIDHIDGLLDPLKYLLDLQKVWRNVQTRSGLRERTIVPGPEPPGCYIVVEKILGASEPLSASWPVQGTTGYEFLGRLGGLFVEPAGAKRIREIYRSFTGQLDPFADVLYESKKLVMKAAMSSELTVLARKLDRISEQHRYSRDFTLNSLQDGLAELIACFPVYRTYIRPDDDAVGETDRLHIEAAVRCAKRRNPATAASVFDFIRALLLLANPEGLEDRDREERRDFVLRFQQLTGPVMAKGLEDTAFYRYFPLAALNEVGGDPNALGTSIEDWHLSNVERLRRHPHGLSATTTHDTKRGEDVRARISALSEIPKDWQKAIARWRDQNSRHKILVGGREAPDANEEYHFYQTLVGAWPFGGLSADPGFVERIGQYMNKAIKEAKLNTSWISPDDEYDAAVQSFVAATLDPEKNRAFLDDFARFHRRIEAGGCWNGLSQTLLKIAAPGVPDFYQGAELWDLRLVDPDNRRPVDFARRRELLSSIHEDAEHRPERLLVEMMRRPENGRVKLFVTHRALAFRRTRRTLFEHGDYVPIEAAGKRSAHVVAFARVHENDCALAAAARFPVGLTPAGKPPIGERAWTNTTLLLPDYFPFRSYCDALTGRPFEVVEEAGRRVLQTANVFAQLPVALLEGIR